MISHLQTQKQYVLTLIKKYKHDPIIVNLLQVLTCLNVNHEAFINTYQQLPKDQIEPRKEYFKVLVEAFIFCRGENKEKQIQIIKTILGELLQRQNNSNTYLDLIPKDIFLEVKSYNPRTYLRKEAKQIAKNEAIVQNSNIINASAGYSQVLILLNKYFSDGDIQFSQIWKVVFLLAQQYNLDMNKITFMTIDLMVNCHSPQKLRESLGFFNQQRVKAFIISFVRNGIERTHQIKDHGHLSQLVDKSPQSLYKDKIIHFNPGHIKVLHSLLEAKIFTIEQLTYNLPTTSSQFHMNLDSYIHEAYKVRVRELYVVKLYEDNNIFTENQMTMLMGQVGNCFKLALMTEYTKNNQFEKTKQIYQSFYLKKIHLNLYAPMITELCRLIEWILEPYIRLNAKNKIFSEHNFPVGYFKQSTELDMSTLTQINQIMSYLGFHIGYSERTFKTLCNAFSYFFTETSVHLEKQQIKSEIKGIIQKYLIAAVSMQQNEVLPNKLQHVLLKLSQIERFSLYCYFRENVMFNHLILVIQFQKGYWKKFNTLKLGLPSKSDLNEIRKFESNNMFRCCYNILKVITDDVIQEKIKLAISIIGQTNYILSEITLFFCLEHVLTNEVDLMWRYDAPNPKYLDITKFISTLLIEFPDIELTALFTASIARLDHNIPEPLSSVAQIPHYNPNFFLVKLISQILEEIFPYKILDMSPDQINNEDFYTYGYYLRVYMSGSEEQYQKAAKIRKYFVEQLLEKNKSQHTYLYEFIRALNNHYQRLSRYSQSQKHQQNGDRTIEKHARTLDECNILINHLLQLVSVVDFEQRSRDQSLHSKIYAAAFIQLGTLNLEMPHFRLIFRQLFKQDFQSNIFEYIRDSMSHFIHKRFKLSEQLKRLQNAIQQSETKQFLYSDFYLFFWLSENYHITDMEEVYCNKLTQMRHKKQVQISRKLTSQEKINTNTTNLTEHISIEKTEFLFLYKRYHNFVFLGCSPQNKSQSIRKLKIPSAFKEKEKRAEGFRNKKQKIKESFTCLFFSFCILPRMLNSPSDALYCSRFTLRLIKQNQVPSSHAIRMIFYLIEGAIDHIKYSTEREATRSIPIFVNDLLRLFKDWHSSQKIAKNMIRLNEEHWNERKYNMLRSYINESMRKITQNLLKPASNNLVIKNTITFLEKTGNMPFIKQHGFLIIEYFQKLKTVEKLNPITKSRVEILTSILKSRIDTVPMMNKEKKSTEQIILDVRGQIYNKNKIVNRGGLISADSNNRPTRRNMTIKSKSFEEKGEVIVLDD